MTEAEFKGRTKRFALDVVAFVDSVPGDRVSEHFCRQLLRCGTSVAANYRAACRAKSAADTIAKLGIVEEEADECGLWLELLVETKRASADRTLSLQREASEILAMTVSSLVTLRRNNPKFNIADPASGNRKSAIAN